MTLTQTIHTEEELFNKKFGSVTGDMLNPWGFDGSQRQLEKKYIELHDFLKASHQRILQAVVEHLDEMAFESDNGTKIELFINWDKAKTTLIEAIGDQNHT